MLCLQVQRQIFLRRTQTDTYRKRDEYKRTLEAGVRAELTGLSFFHYAARWVHAYKTGCNEATFKAYIHHFENAGHMIGGKALRDITATDMQFVYNAQAGKSTSPIEKHCTTMK